MKYDFKQELLKSKELVNKSNIKDILLNYFGGDMLVESVIDEDKNGTDWWVKNVAGRDISIDVKIREKDYGKNDICLEIWSAKEYDRVGWTLNNEKRTDYILYYWNDTKRWCLIPFPMLYKVTITNKEDWMNKYPYKPTINNGYTTWCVYVPINIVWKCIYVLNNLQ